MYRFDKKQRSAKMEKQTSVWNCK